VTCSHAEYIPSGGCSVLVSTAEASPVPVDDVVPDVSGSSVVDPLSVVIGSLDSVSSSSIVEDEVADELIVVLAAVTDALPNELAFSLPSPTVHAASTTSTHIGRTRSASNTASS
jgi:hypothetical protein